MNQNAGRSRLRPPARLWRKLRPLAREYRAKPIKAEDELWQSLRVFRLRGFIFRRQHAIGRYVVDFYCPKARLVVEVDGPIHGRQVEEDANRSAFLASQRLRVVRFKNSDVFQDIDNVINRIEADLDLPPLLAKRGD